MSDFETTVLMKPEGFVYRLPPRASNRGFRAADWDLEHPMWSGRVKIITKGDAIVVKLEDKTTGELFAPCPVDAYPGTAVEPVLDSSRYFVLRIVDPNGRHAFVGLGFGDRGDSFDFQVALQDHFKWLAQSKEIEKQVAAAKSNPQPTLDLGLKAGEKITINFGKKSAVGAGSATSSSSAGFADHSSFILPPPPAAGSTVLAPPPGSGSGRARGHQQAAPASVQPSFFGGAQQPPQQQQQQQQSLLGFDFLGGAVSAPAQTQARPAQAADPFDWTKGF